MKITFILSMLLFFSSCSKSPNEEVADAIDIAQTYLSESKCQDAIDVLESVNASSDNGIYLQVLASAYSCRAGFSEINFTSDDVPDIDVSSNVLLFKSLTKLSLSSETAIDSDEYTDIQLALSYLLDSAGAQPTHAARVAKFGSRRANDLSVQILFLSAVQLGKFLNFFGNANASGEKGEGIQGTNECFLNYNDTDAKNVVQNYPASNNCDSFSAGHSGLDLTTQDGRRRACEGLVLFNNLIDILSNVDLSGNSSLSGLVNINNVIESMKDTAITAHSSLGTLFNTTSQSACETLLNTPAEVENLELLYALIFESGLE